MTEQAKKPTVSNPVEAVVISTRSIVAIESCIAVVKQEMETADLIYDNKRDQAIYKSALSNAIVMMIDDIAIQSESCTDEVILKLNMKYL